MPPASELLDTTNLGGELVTEHMAMDMVKLLDFGRENMGGFGVLLGNVAVYI